MTVHDAARAVLDSSTSKQRSAIAKLWLLKTCAGELGLVMIETLLTDLGRAAASGDLTHSQRIAEQLCEYVMHVQVVYRRVAEPVRGTSVSRTG